MGLFDIFKKKKIVLTEEQRRENKMWELWTEDKAVSPYAELMTYQSEINNGGHDQYFFNVNNTRDLQREMAAVEQNLSAELKDNLIKAYKAYLVLEEKEDDEKAEEILEQCDDVFYEHEEEINRILTNYASSIELWFRFFLCTGYFDLDIKSPPEVDYGYSPGLFWGIVLFGRRACRYQTVTWRESWRLPIARSAK